MQKIHCILFKSETGEYSYSLAWLPSKSGKRAVEAMSLVSKKFCKIFQISRHIIESLDVCIEY